jgi:hypothetical protein
MLATSARGWPLLGSFVALVAAAGFGLARAERLKMLSGALGRLGDTTAQIRVRGAVLLLIGFAAFDCFGSINPAQPLPNQR